MAWECAAVKAEMTGVWNWGVTRPGRGRWSPVADASGRKARSASLLPALAEKVPEGRMTAAPPGGAEATVDVGRDTDLRKA